MLLRKELCEKYSPTFYDYKNMTKAEIIKALKNYQKSLISLIDEVDLMEKETSITFNPLNERQTMCIKNCSEEFVDSGWSNPIDTYRQSFNEMRDFIYSSGFENSELAVNELKLVKMMSSYLIFKADELLWQIKNTDIKINNGY